MTTKEAADLQNKIYKSRKQNNIPEIDLFGDVTFDILQRYKQIFKAIISNKDYVFIRKEVIGKKNNYIAAKRFTGKSDCCNADYDKKTKICTACGKITKSGEIRTIMLNEKALNYFNGVLPEFIKAYNKIHSQKKTEKFTLIGVFFIRGSNRRFDFDNVETMIGDLLSKSRIIEDDSANQFMIIPMGYIIDKDNSGIILSVLDHEKYFDYLITNYEPIHSRENK
jgi:hypothetical protein